MTKADIINTIAMNTGLQKKDVAVVVESFMETIKNSLLENKENVYLRGFGSFVIKHRAAKTARNILQKTTMIIDAHDLPSFKPAKCFVDQMKENVSNLTKEAIERFEKDVAEGKEVDINNYVDTSVKEYNNKYSSLGLGISTAIDKGVNKSIDFFLKIIKTLFS